MSTFLTVVIVISAIFIVFAVILQPSKDGGLGGLASGGVTDSVFGTNRNEFLAKTTWWLMAIFLISSIVLAKHRTTEHEENEAEINTRSNIEEMGETKSTESKIKNDAGAVEKTIDEAKKDAAETKGAVEKTIDEAKKDAETKVDDSKSELENKVDEAKKDATDALNKALPKTE